MMSDIFSTCTQFFESNYNAFNAYNFMRARPLVLKLARAFSSRLEPNAHVKPRRDNSLYGADVILISLSL